MADRTMKAGDTWPPLKGNASDADGPVNLSTASSLEVRIKGTGGTEIVGAASAIWPAETDREGTWNWQYAWEAGDTADPDDYEVELVVTWSAGEIETFPNDGAATLVIEARKT